MDQVKRLMILKVLTPMHAGGGNEISVVDLPIQREIHTNFPKIEASTIKGCIRSAYHFQKEGDTTEQAIFGTEQKDNMFASAVSFTDGRILFFPVRSAKGIFAYITCPYVLNRFFNDVDAMGIKVGINKPKDGLKIDENKICVTSDQLNIGDKKAAIVLEEYTFDQISKEDEFKGIVSGIAKYLPSLGFTDDFEQKCVLLPDDDFLHFVEMSTDVITRIKVETTTGTTAGGLFDEEYLPAESILYDFFFAEKSRAQDSKLTAEKIAKEIEDLLKNPIQIGGNATLGKGFTACRLCGEEGSNDES